MSHLLVERAFILTPAETQCQNHIIHLLFASVLPSTGWVLHKDARRKENMHQTQYVALQWHRWFYNTLLSVIPQLLLSGRLFIERDL